MYGQVVAVDAFGEAFVIPLLSILEEIESCPGVTRACLPSTQNIRRISASKISIDVNSLREPPTWRLPEQLYPKSNCADSGYGSTSNKSSTCDDGRDALILERELVGIPVQNDSFLVANTGLWGASDLNFYPGPLQISQPRPILPSDLLGASLFSDYLEPRTESRLGPLNDSDQIALDVLLSLFSRRADY